MTATPIIINLAGRPYEGSDGLLWVHGLSRARIEYEGKPYPFDDEVVFGGVFEGLAAQINEARHQPNYQVDEDMAGHNRGSKTSIAGVVRQVRRVTQEDLAAQGVHIEEPEAIMFGIELNSFGKELKANGQLRFSSLGLSIIRQDERLDPETNEPLRSWSAFLREMSGCGQPHLKHLRPIEETEHLQLSELTTAPSEIMSETTSTLNLSAEQLDEIVERVAMKIKLAEMSPELEQLNQMVADAPGDRSELLASMATAAGVEVGAVEAILAGDVVPSETQLAAMMAVLQPAEVDAGYGYDKMAMAELAVLKADNKALRADFSAHVADRKREETKRAIYDRAREDKIRVDFSADENAGMFELLCSQYEDAPETFDSLWGKLSRDTRDGSGRQHRAPKSAGDEVRFSIMPSTNEQVRANKQLIASYRAEHGCSYTEASEALKRAARA